MWVNDYNSDLDNPLREQPFVKIQYLSYTDNLPAWSYGYHHHEDIYELTFVVESSGTLLLESDRLPLKLGDIVIMPPGMLHCYTCGSGEAMQYYSIWVDAESNEGEIQSFLKEIRGKPAIISAFKYLDYIQSSFHILGELHQINNGVLDETCQSIYLSLLMLIKKIYLYRAMVVSISPSSYASDVLWYINRHVSEDLSLELLAKQFHISPSHLRRIFKQVYGISPIHYLIKRRIAMATDYLLKTDMTVAEVAPAGRLRKYDPLLPPVCRPDRLYSQRIPAPPPETRSFEGDKRLCMNFSGPPVSSALPASFLPLFNRDDYKSG